MELSDILGDAPAPEEKAESTVENPEPEQPQQAAPEPEPTPTVEQPSEPQPRDDRGRFAKREDEAQPPASPEEKPHTVPVSALIEERRRRQDLEARLQALEKAEKPPEVTNDQFWQSPVETAKQISDRSAQAIQQEIQHLKYQLAEDLTRSMFQDYDAVRDEFVELAQTSDPMAVAIAAQMGLHSNPARFVYEQMQRLKSLNAVGDLKSYEERIRAEERARLLTESQRPAPVPDVPPSLNSEASAPVPANSFAPTPLKTLFQR